MRKMLFQKKCPPLFVLILLAALAGSSCKNSRGDESPDYTLKTPTHITLGKALNEISGICYNDKDSTLLAISDSKERVFQLSIKNKKLKDYTDKVIASNSDVEDIVKVDSSIYLLLSKGIIKELKDGQMDSAGMKTYALNLTGTNDFESLYYDPSVKGLVLLCKTCAHEKGLGIRTAYRFDLTTKTFDTSAFFTIRKDEVRNLLKNSDAKFDPSAAAIHPINKRLYILSSAGNLLVVADTRGKVVEAYALNPDDFPQAEGIAFAPNGTMFISNEGKYGRPSLLLFPYHQNEKKK